MNATIDVETWLRRTCNGYRYDLSGVLRRSGQQTWPLIAASAQDLEAQLARSGHLLPLPKEPAALANVLEVSIVDFLLDHLAATPGTTGARGTERAYPDLELSGPAFGGGFHAIDVKIAQRRATRKRVSESTQSRITLYTGNTYFRYPDIWWPNTFRPFAEYTSHLDVIGIYTLDTSSNNRVTNLELIVQQPWKIASRKRSSTTREYIGAVQNIEAIRQGRGEFATPEEFYQYWRRFPFKIGNVVQQQLDKLLKQQTPASSSHPQSARPVTPPLFTSPVNGANFRNTDGL